MCYKKQQELIPALLQVLCNEGGLLRNRGRGPFGGTVAFHDEGYLVKSWGWSLHCHWIRWVCGFLEPFVVQCWQISATLLSTGPRAETFFFKTEFLLSSLLSICFLASVLRKPGLLRSSIDQFWQFLAQKRHATLSFLNDCSMTLIQSGKWS